MSTDVRWDSDRALLYAAGVGETLLAFATENSHETPQQVLPTFGVMLCDPFPAIDALGPIDHGRVVHGSEALRVHAPLPPSGTLRVSSGVTKLIDKGIGGHVVVELTANGHDEAGRQVVERTSTLVLRGAGGTMNGYLPHAASEQLSRPAVDTVEVPGRQPDVLRVFEVTEALPLLYRLSGDRNPLHSDPWFAVHRAGFPRTILHGLCTFAIAGRTLLHGVCGSDPSRFEAMAARFVAPVFPGERLTTQVWVIDEVRGAFRVLASGNDVAPERVVLDYGSFARRDKGDSEEARHQHPDE
jgi:acyl dehydratase